MTSTTPANPEPIKWDPDTMTSVPLSAVMNAAYNASDSVTLTIYDTEQNVKKTFTAQQLIGASATTVTNTWDGSLDTGTDKAPKGIYLFKWVASNSSIGDSDTDKSTTTTIDQTHLNYDYDRRYWLTDWDLTGPRQGGFVKVYLADLTEMDPVTGDSVPAGFHAEMPDFKFPEQGKQVFLMNAQDMGDILHTDRGHRDRWALQRNQSADGWPAAFLGLRFLPLSKRQNTDWIVEKAWKQLRAKPPFRVNAQRYCKWVPVKGELDAPLINKNASKGRELLTKARLWVYIGHVPGGRYRGYALEFSENTYLSGLRFNYPWPDESGYPPNVEKLSANKISCIGDLPDPKMGQRLLDCTIALGCASARGATRWDRFDPPDHSNRRYKTLGWFPWESVFGQLSRILPVGNTLQLSEWRVGSWCQISPADASQWLLRFIDNLANPTVDYVDYRTAITKTNQIDTDSAAIKGARQVEFCGSDAQPWVVNEELVTPIETILTEMRKLGDRGEKEAEKYETFK